MWTTALPDDADGTAAAADPDGAARYGGLVLVLGRRVGESIVISGEITVTVLEVRGEMVRVGIDAPRSVAVQRAELLQELEESNKASASPSEDAVEALSRRLGGRAQG
jgi:carbon storage regulator